MILDRFCIKDDDYWLDPWICRKALQRPLMQNREEGLLLGAPAIVALNVHEEFPVALIRVAKLATLSKVPTRPTVIITAMDLGTSELRARLALPGAQFQEAAPGAPPAAKDSFSDDDSAMISEGHTIDLSKRLDVPAVRGQHLVTAILLDQVSNRCRMKLSESAGFDDPAVEEFVREHRAQKRKPSEIFPAVSEPHTSYRHEQDSPPIPIEVGISLAVPRVQIFNSKSRCVVKGSFRLPVSPQHLVKDDIAAGVVSKAPPESARVPVSLLITGSVDAAPQVVSLVIPSYEPVKSTGGETLALGYFSFDLCRLANLLVTPQTYFIYAFCGEYMTDPIPSAFVRLPQALEEEMDDET